MGTPSYMQSVIDRNVVVRRMTVHMQTCCRNIRTLLISMQHHVGDLFGAVRSEYFLKEETKVKKAALMQCRCR
jgi:hypothetical protein